MRFLPNNPLDVIRLYESGASICRLAEACCVSDSTMVQFLRDQDVYKRTYTVTKTKVNKTPERPIHISGQELSDDWWESNNQAFCDAMERGYPGMKF